MQVLGILKSPVRLLASSNTLVALLHSGWCCGPAREQQGHSDMQLLGAFLMPTHA
jgi:hypothetical protein